MADIENTNPIDTAGEPSTKGKRFYEKPEETVRRYNIALTNAQADPGILAELKKFRFDEARLKEGMALITKTIELFAVQKKEFGEQLEASQTVKGPYEQVQSGV